MTGKQKIIIFSAAAAMLCLTGAGIILLYRFDPENCSFFPPCVFNRLTGWHCIGCGTTRAVHALLHGEVQKAFRMNFMFLPSILFWGCYLFSPLRKKILPVIIWLGMVCIFAVLRNLPSDPFALAPL